METERPVSRVFAVTQIRYGVAWARVIIAVLEGSWHS